MLIAHGSLSSVRSALIISFPRPLFLKALEALLKMVMETEREKKSSIDDGD
jgi:hypothetical protein